MGDPSTQLWTSSSKQLVVNHNETISNGSSNFQVEILNDFGVPQSDVIVTLYKPGLSTPDLQITSLSNDETSRAKP